MHTAHWPATAADEDLFAWPKGAGKIEQMVYRVNIVIWSRSAAEKAGHPILQTASIKFTINSKTNSTRKILGRQRHRQNRLGRFLCPVHNLMVCYEATPVKAGIRNEAEEKRRKKVLTERAAKVEKTGRKMALLISGFQRLTQRTVKFIRWLRRFLWQTHRLDDPLRILRKRYKTL